MHTKRKEQAHTISSQGGLHYLGIPAGEQLMNTASEGNCCIIKRCISVVIWTVVDERLKPTGYL